MTEATTNQNAQADARRPSHVAYWVKDRENKKSEWRRIGVAWQHADGKGFNVALDLQPLDGRITLRTVEDRHE
jgi:hypothetical protein